MARPTATCPPNSTETPLPPRWRRPAGLLTAVVLLAAWLAGGAAPARAQVDVPVLIDRHQGLFTVLCALYAAGFEEEAGALGFHPMRRRLMPQLRRLEGPAVEKVREFYRAHLLADPAAVLSRYVSLGLVVGPPPDFAYTLRRTDLPPDVRTIEAFNDLLPAFYQEARIELLWRSLAAEYEQEIARLQQPLGQVVVVVTGYLREILSAGQVRSFTLVVEPLVGARTNFRSYGDRYYLVMGPRAEPPVEEIRHAFLHFLLDPLAIRYGEAVRAKEPLSRIAGLAPQLPYEYKNDFSLLITECLVRAVELRLDRLKPEPLEAALDEADRAGYILVRPLYAALDHYEQSEPAMSLFFPDLLRRVRVGAEARRLADFEFSTASPVTAHPGLAGGEAVDPVEALLRSGERAIATQDAAAAESAFTEALEQHPGHPRALYGLAVAVTMQGQVERAKDLFRRLVAAPAAGNGGNSPVPPTLRSWAHVYLGRIYDLEGERELALTEYRAALALPGAPETARAAAERGIAKPFETVPR